MLSSTFRLLIASVKKECPRCLIPVRKFREMGMLRDKMRRHTLARRDNSQTRRKAAEARKAIYQGRYAVDGERVKAILGEQSLAPVPVRANTSTWIKPNLTLLFRVLSLRGYQMPILTRFQCLSLISCMSLNRAFGRRYSFIYFACLILEGARSLMN
jgi:hypothetical protein